MSEATLQASWYVMIKALYFPRQKNR